MSIDTTGLDPDQVNALEYVLELLQHGLQPRIVNITADMVKQEIEDRGQRYALPTKFAGIAGDPDALWALAKKMDEEVENSHHFLDGADEAMNDAILEVLDITEEIMEEDEARV